MIIRGVKLNGVGFIKDVAPIITNNLVANYDAATGISGSTFLDSSVNSYNATLYGSPTTTKVNGTTVLQLSSASSQYVGYTGGYGTLLNGASGFTYDVWFSPITASGTLICEYSNSTFNSGWQDSQMGILSSGKLNTGVYNSSGAGLNPYVVGPTITTSTWYNCVLTYNGSNTITEYVNGVSVGSSTFGTPKTNPPGSIPYATYLTLGKSDTTGYYCGGVTGYFNGYIGAWKVYSSALTTTQISQNFNALRSRYGV